MDKTERIHKLNRDIIDLLLKRNKLARYNSNWPEEEKIYKQIEELERQIKQIEAEDA